MADTRELEHFKQACRNICLEMENLAIENRFYFDLILSKNFNPSSDSLKEALARALADPVLRSEVHQQYAETWRALEEAGTDAVFEDMLERLPPTDKPN